MKTAPSLYLASSFARRGELEVYAVRLRAKGFAVVSRWHDDVTHQLQIDANLDPDGAFAHNRRLALDDLEDIERADALALFAPTTAGRGGCDFEAGVAFAKGKGLYLVGPRTNVFTYLLEVEHFPTFEFFLNRIVARREEARDA